MAAPPAPGNLPHALPLGPPDRDVLTLCKRLMAARDNRSQSRIHVSVAEPAKCNGSNTPFWTSPGRSHDFVGSFYAVAATAKSPSPPFNLSSKGAAAARQFLGLLDDVLYPPHS